jgi:hypothetical protein
VRLLWDAMFDGDQSSAQLSGIEATHNWSTGNLSTTAIGMTPSSYFYKQTLKLNSDNTCQSIIYHMTIIITIIIIYLQTKKIAVKFLTTKILLR